MRSPLLILILLAAVFSTSGQDAACPSVVVTGPSGLPNTEIPIRYVVQILPPERAVGLSYLWTVSTQNGPKGMVRGQGTTEIEVPFTEDHITVLVEVKGLPEGCPANASETMTVDWAPTASKLSEMTGKLSGQPSEVFLSIKRQIENNPTDRFALIVYPGKSGSIDAKKRSLLSRFGGKNAEFTKRLQFVTSDIRLDKVEIWLVPAGADLPKP